MSQYPTDHIQLLEEWNEGHRFIVHSTKELKEGKITVLTQVVEVQLQRFSDDETSDKEAQWVTLLEDLIVSIYFEDTLKRLVVFTDDTSYVGAKRTQVLVDDIIRTS
jgi:hypothetical protein